MPIFLSFLLIHTHVGLFAAWIQAGYLSQSPLPSLRGKEVSIAGFNAPPPDTTHNASPGPILFEPSPRHSHSHISYFYGPTYQHQVIFRCGRSVRPRAICSCRSLPCGASGTLGCLCRCTHVFLIQKSMLPVLQIRAKLALDPQICE